jgi:HPt (histidine-containing phosphotransfer) domain-containing protein
MSSELPFSMATLMEQCGGMASVVVTVLDEFLKQVPTDTNEMETGLASGDLLTVSKAAHRLKGTAGVLGASKLHPLCAALELAGKQGNADEAAKIYGELKTEAQLCADAVPVAKTKL